MDLHIDTIALEKYKFIFRHVGLVAIGLELGLADNVYCRVGNILAYGCALLGLALGIGLGIVA